MDTKVQKKVFYNNNRDLNWVEICHKVLLLRFLHMNVEDFLKYAVSTPCWSFRYVKIPHNLKKLIKFRKRKTLSCKCLRVKKSIISTSFQISDTITAYTDSAVRKTTGSASTRVSYFATCIQSSYCSALLGNYVTSFWFSYQWKRHLYIPIRGWFLFQGLLLILFQREISEQAPVF
jgi:hypothetical protein